MLRTTDTQENPEFFQPQISSSQDSLFLSGIAGLHEILDHKGPRQPQPATVPS